MSAALPPYRADFMRNPESAFDFKRHPGRELERDVLMRVDTAIPARPGDETDGAGGVDPAPGGEDEAVEAWLLLNPIEFDGIEIRVVQLLSDAKKLNRIAVAEPAGSPTTGVAGLYRGL